MSKKMATLAQLLESARRSEALTMQVAQTAQTALSGKASNPNLLDNWYFVDPINQRGQTKYIGGYTIDRWNLIGSGQVEIVDGGIKVSQEESFQIYWRYAFDPDESKNLAGKTVTVSLLSSSGYENLGINIFSGNQYLGEVGSSVGINSKTIALPSDLTEFILQFGGAAAGYAIIQAAKVELGPVQTLAHQDADGNWVLNDPPPNKALELLKCQRDQMVYKNQDCVGIAIGNTILIQKPCMRANPTVLQNGATLDIASYTVGLNELTLQSVTANNAFIVAKVQNMNFDCTPVFVKYDSPAPLILDANL